MNLPVVSIFFFTVILLISSIQENNIDNLRSSGQTLKVGLDSVTVAGKVSMLTQVNIIACAYPTLAAISMLWLELICYLSLPERYCTL
jgi:hypothetical protein